MPRPKAQKPKVESRNDILENSLLKKNRADSKEINRLKEAVFTLFTLAGFNVTKDADLSNNKVDLLIESNTFDFKAVCLFRHESSDQLVRDLIVNWSEKGETLGVNKIILIVDGIEVLGEDRLVAEQHKIEIWEKDNIHDYYDNLHRHPKDGKRKFLTALGLDSYIDSDVISEPIVREL